MIWGLGMSKGLSPVTNTVIFCPAAPLTPSAAQGKKRTAGWTEMQGQGQGQGTLSPASQDIASGHLHSPQDSQHGASLEPSIWLFPLKIDFPKFGKHFLSPYSLPSTMLGAFYLCSHSIGWGSQFLTSDIIVMVVLLHQIVSFFIFISHYPITVKNR